MDLRGDLKAIRDAALHAVDPFVAVRRALGAAPPVAEPGPADAGWIAPAQEERLLVVAVGKAAVPMAAAAADVLGERVAAGVVVTKYGHTLGYTLSETWRVFEAGHPIPDLAGREASEAVVQLLASSREGERVLVLLSGGASALLPAPVPDVTLDDLQSTTDLLLRAGAPIGALNAVRKHLSRLKGGQLARLADPARVTALILSDVVGDPLDVIASGPTAPDPTRYADALAVLDTYSVTDRAPAAVMRHLRAGAEGGLAETPKPGEGLFDRVSNVIIGSNALAAEAAVRQAAALGYAALLLTTFLEGEAREIAKVTVALARSVRASGQPLAAPACLVLGGETTVTVHGQGKGGRNQELALSAALGLAGMDDVALMALATDGTDGPTDAAGAVVGGDSLRKAKALGWDPRATLDDNNAYPLLAATGDLLRLGPTGTNVNDLLVLLVG